MAFDPVGGDKQSKHQTFKGKMFSQCKFVSLTVLAFGEKEKRTPFHRIVSNIRKSW